MTLRLILMRHAKSSWDNPGWDDHERPLNDRGHKSARALGQWLTQKGYLPDQILCSDAVRTRQTASELGLTAPIVDFPALYHAEATTMLDMLRLNASGQCVALVAHNPGCADFASRIVAHPPAHPRFHDYPTGATLVVDLPADIWPAAAFHSGTVAEFIVPRELTDRDQG